MLTRLLLLLSLFGLLPSCVYDSKSENELPSPLWTIQQPLPSFSVTTSDGRTLTPESLKGTVAVIVFFNTNCSDCQQFLPTIEALHQQIQSGTFSLHVPVTLLPISRAQTVEEVNRYWQQHSFSFPFAATKDHSIYQLFARSGIPRVYIATSEGIAFQCFDDKNPPSLEILKKSIEQAALSSFK